MQDKYNQLVKENGFLTASGEKLVNKQFLPAVKELLDMVRTDNELMVLGSILSNLVGKEVSTTIQNRSLQQEVVSEIITQIFDPFDA